ncbi:MAG: LLM class flavin-dependent oxidoreductase, partial [Acidimicrobiia bacterium]
LGIDTIAFAGAIAPQLRRMHLLTAVRMGEMWVPQLARQLATLDQVLDGRLTINIISSDIPGEQLPSEPRYQRTLEWMQVLRALLSGEPIDFHGEFLDLELEPPRIARELGHPAPPFYFGGFSEPAKDVAAREADVFLTWPDTVDGVGETMADMAQRAAGYGRELVYGLRAHVIVRETEAEARTAASRLVSKLDDEVGTAIRGKSLDAASKGVARQSELRDSSDDEGYVEENLWTGVGRARSGAGAAIVGDPDQVVAKIEAYRRVGVGAFIFSGYPHAAECDLFARYVLPQLDHAPLRPRWTRSE